MYQVQCPWCSVFQEAEFWEDIESHIEACWKKVSEEERGTLESWGHRETWPVTYHAGMGP